MAHVTTLFEKCVNAIRRGDLIHRVGEKDKEFHFQNWFRKRIEELNISYKQGKRNAYPDFTVDDSPLGFELKGLAHPGRWASYDSNSQVPRGSHAGRDIYYVFGRYPKKPKADSYPVIDLVICHGSLLNAHNEYVHANKSFRGFGAFGDILVRDRKMYVAPTPFALAEGLSLQRTLIVPLAQWVPPQLQQVGILARREAPEVVAAYSFDLQTNELATKKANNPQVGIEHNFAAYRLDGDVLETVRLRDQAEIVAEIEEPDEDDDSE